MFPSEGQHRAEKMEVEFTKGIDIFMTLLDFLS